MAKILIRRGLKARLPTLTDGELGFCTDTQELYVGTTNGNKLIGTGADMFKSVYDTNNNGKVDNAEKADSVPWSGVTGKPSTFTPASHTHGDNDLPLTFRNLTDGASNLPYRKDIILYGDSDKYYPVHFAKGNQNLLRTIKIWRAYSEKAPPDWYSSTHKGSLNLVWMGNYGAWGGASYQEYIYENSSQYTVLLADCRLVDNSYAYAFYLRGGGTTGAIYHIASDQPLDWTDSYLTYREPTAFYNQDLTFNHTNDLYKKYAGAPLTSVNSTRIANMTVAKIGDVPSIKVNSAVKADSANAVAWANVSSKPAQATRWPAWSEVSSKPSTFTPSVHSHSVGDLPSATTSAKGIVQLSNSVSSTSTSLAATASAVKAAYDKGNHSHPYASSSHNHDGTYAPASHSHSYAPVSHSHSATDLPSASTSAKGVVQLSSSTSSTSTTLAATASAVRAAYNLANGKANATHTHVMADITDLAGGGLKAVEGYWFGDGSSTKNIAYSGITNPMLLFIYLDTAGYWISLLGPEAKSSLRASSITFFSYDGDASFSLGRSYGNFDFGYIRVTSPELNQSRYYNYVVIGT